MNTYAATCAACSRSFELAVGHARPFCDDCLTSMKDDIAERTSRIARGDLQLFNEGATAAEQADIIRNRRTMNITGA